MVTTNDQQKYLGSTVGLMATRLGVSRLVRVQFTRNPNRTVTLQPVSGERLNNLKGRSVITSDAFSDRPDTTYEQVSEARWALELCGWTLACDDDEDDCDD